MISPPYFSYEGSGGIPQPGRGSCSLSEQFPDYGAVPEGTCFCKKEGRYKIIYVAPERLETAEFMDFAMSVDISMIAVDEAHCVSQWGQDFRPSYLKITEFVEYLPKGRL